MLGRRPVATVRVRRRVFGLEWPLEAHECVSCAVVGVEEVVYFLEPCLLECSERDGVACLRVGEAGNRRWAGEHDLA
jgi:hypothetical protein